MGCLIQPAFLPKGLSDMSESNIAVTCPPLANWTQILKPGFPALMDCNGTTSPAYHGCPLWSWVSYLVWLYLSPMLAHVCLIYKVFRISCLLRCCCPVCSTMGSWSLVGPLYTIGLQVMNNKSIFAMQGQRMQNSEAERGWQVLILL